MNEVIGGTGVSPACFSAGVTSRAGRPRHRKRPHLVIASVARQSLQPVTSPTLSLQAQRGNLFNQRFALIVIPAQAGISSSSASADCYSFISTDEHR